MLSKPVNGWTTVSIKDFQTEASYLVDIPFEWLNTCLNGFKYKIPISLFIDEEGRECFIITYYDVTHIITDRDDEVACSTYRDIDFMDITDMLLNDIRKYFENWIVWSPYEDAETDFQRRRIELSKLIEEVENALKTEKERCHKIRKHDADRL